jgi:kumamolisin
VNYLIYAEAAQQRTGSWFPFFRQNIEGYNGLYNGGGSYNYVVGNGTPIGTNFILAPGIPPAGTPQTSSNP